MIGSDALGNILQHHGFTGFRWRDNQTALSFSDRCRHIYYTSGQVFGTTIAHFQSQTLIGKQGCQAFEGNLVLGIFRRLKIDLGDLKHGKVTFTIFRWSNLAGDGIAGAQAEAANLAG